ATQGELRLGCLLPVSPPSDQPRNDVLADLITSHLYEEVRERLGVSYGVDGAAHTLRGGASHLVIAGRRDNAGLAPALQAIHEFWDELARRGPDAVELERARWKVARRFNLRFATTRAMVGAVLATRNRGWPLASLDQYPERLAAVTA